jgi:hypothetical protein
LGLALLAPAKNAALTLQVQAVMRTADIRRNVGARAKIAALVYGSGTPGGQPTSDEMWVPEQKLLRLFMGLAHQV